MPQLFQFPFFLLDQPISTTAKIVYMILYDRSRLSMQNGWQSDGKIYTIYPIALLLFFLILQRSVFRFRGRRRCYFSDLAIAIRMP